MSLHSRSAPRSGHLASTKSPTLLLLLFFLLATILTCANGALIHTDEPEVIFSTPRPVTPPTAQGNGIQPSPDGSLIYLTSADGTLTALNARSGQVRFTIQPRPRDDGWSTECNSGIALYHDQDDANNGGGGSVSDYLVYAIIDIPPTSSTEEVSSRIFAVDVEDTDDGVLRWVTSPIPGRIGGTPAIDSSGLYVYYVHNEVVDGSGGGNMLGHFSIVNDPAEGELLYTAPSPTNDAFAPLDIAHSPIRGNYDGGESNRNDLLVWGSASSPSQSGHTYAFQFPANFRKGSKNTRLFEIVTLQEVNWATSAAPALSSAGNSLYFGTESVGVNGWVSEPFDSEPTWERNVNVLPVAPVLTQDGDTIFVATNNAFHALNSATGLTRWRNRQFGSQILSRSVMSRDSESVYFAEESGTVYSSDVLSGRQSWALEMDGDVVSDLALSVDSTTLYVVTSDGEVSGIKVAEDDGRPTARPTGRPTFVEPTPNIATPSPSKRPTSRSPAPTKRPSPAPIAPFPTRVPPTRAPPTVRPPTPIPPTPAPEVRPTPAPQAPRARPTKAPVRNPTNGAGDRPTYEPTLEPTIEIQPSSRPTARPTRTPVAEETLPPSAAICCHARSSLGFAAVALALHLLQ